MELMKLLGTVIVLFQPGCASKVDGAFCQVQVQMQEDTVSGKTGMGEDEVNWRPAGCAYSNYQWVACGLALGTTDLVDLKYRRTLAKHSHPKVLSLVASSCHLTDTEHLQKRRISCTYHRVVPWDSLCPGQTICRSGTQRPCYKVSYIQDSRWRLTFEDARKACRADGGELLSIETESEQRLIEMFIQRVQPGDGDFWIGLHRGPRHHTAGATSPGCPSQYYWLDGSKAKFRNWHSSEPPCGRGMCVVLSHQPTAPPDKGRFLLRWNDDSCSSKNNFVCKYREEKAPVVADEGRTANTVPSLTPPLLSTTRGDKSIKIEPPETSVSFSDNNLYVSYVLYATIPALLVLMSAAAGFLCYKHRAKRRKTEADACPNRPKPWMSTAAPPCPVQGPYASSDVTKLPHTALDSTASADIVAEYVFPPSRTSQCDDYENVACTNRGSGFVTNDIYETCRPQSRCGHSPTGWVENEIYG